jgi:omega-amidase
MQDLRISIVQSDLIWEDTDVNLYNFDRKLTSLKGDTDLIVLPEMFNTGFSMNPKKCAETINGKTINWLKAKAEELKSTIIGSILISENNKYFNRLIVMRPDGCFEQYDKRHLFRLAEENVFYTEGKKKIITNINGWKICPLICYDLRFPIWSKNTYNKTSGYEYDCLIFVANWPRQRRFAWESLLVARAIENQAYVIGVNRIGNDGNSVPHSGNSMVLDFKGKSLFTLPDNEEFITTISISKRDLKKFRNQFTVGLDWDQFEIKN